MTNEGLLDQYTRNVARGPDYEPDVTDPGVPSDPLVRLIAFYLPQFHAIPENDKWWGKGFTEWTNVTKVLPRFKGHYQPRLPADLGFYDPTRPDVLTRQASIARRYGVTGFCFHHYWFSGQRLLQAPLEVLLAHPKINLPFCVNWANESWTRRWDGQDRQMLIVQRHSPEDDKAFAASLEPLFRDPRYIRVEGRPLLMLYRPGILPDAAATVKRWREHFVEVGLGNPYVVMAQAFNDGDPTKYGMDAAVGFPPFWAGHDCPRISASLSVLDPGFKGEVVDYQTMANATVESYDGSAKVFPGVCPSWDNQARRQNGGFCFHGSTPEKYGRWLAVACEVAVRNEIPDERMVFINAWNEWAEGAYLEPDRHFGYAYLAETARVVRAIKKTPTVPSKAAAADFVRNHVKTAAVETLRSRASRKTRRMFRKSTNVVADVIDDLAQRLRGI